MKLQQFKKTKNTPPSSLVNQDTQTNIVMVERKDTDLMPKKYRPKLNLESESIVVLLKVAQNELVTTEGQVEK